MAKHVALNFTDEELKLFSDYSLERRSSDFGLEALRKQKRHAEQMLSISRPQLYQAYIMGKEGATTKQMRKEAGVEPDTINKRRRQAVQWLIKALGGVLHEKVA